MSKLQKPEENMTEGLQTNEGADWHAPNNNQESAGGSTSPLETQENQSPTTSLESDTLPWREDPWSKGATPYKQTEANPELWAQKKRMEAASVGQELGSESKAINKVIREGWTKTGETQSLSGHRVEGYKTQKGEYAVATHAKTGDERIKSIDTDEDFEEMINNPFPQKDKGT